MKIKLFFSARRKFFFQSTLKFENIKCFGLFLNQKLIATRFILCYRDILYDWYGTADDQGKKLYANDYMIERIFNWGLKNNFSIFDFGGAGNLKDNSGIREYKLKFGGELIEIGRIHFISKPVHYKLGKLGFSILKKLR